MNFIQELKKNILDGYNITKEEAYKLTSENIESIAICANEIRQHFCGDTFDMCCIINAKSGRCSEDCKFCSQSSHYKTSSLEYPLLDSEKILDDARDKASKGVVRYSLVTSGKKLNSNEISLICETVKSIKESGINIKICGSLGLLTKEEYAKLLEAGLTRMHNNLETSKEYFPQMCSTHTFDDKVLSLTSARDNGMSICSGGIFGIGESMLDRISLAFSLKELNVQSVPINLLNPIKGTPYENNQILSEQELIQTVAIFRFILPTAFIRLAGGRKFLSDKGKSCFNSGANAAITGDMLTTDGISIETDLEILKELNYKVGLGS